MSQPWIEKMKIPANLKIIVEQDRKFSSKLYKQMRIEKCKGDFCVYTMMDRNRGLLALRKSIMDEYKKHFGQKKEDLGNIAISLPHEISNNLILKTRERSEEIVQILIKNKIFKKHSDQKYANEDKKINIEKEYPFTCKKSTV